MAYQLPETAEKALRRVELSQPFHDTIVRNHEKRFKSFEGKMEKFAQAAQWQSQLHPPYLNHIVETHVASLIDDTFSFKVKPKPRLYSQAEFELATLGAKCHEDLHKQQLANDRFNEQQRPIALMAAVDGFSIAKTFWRNEVGPKKRLVMENAAPPELQALGAHIPRLVERETVETLFDGPVTEAVDTPDFYWEEAAPHLDKSAWCAHAVWLTLEDIQALAKKGVYDPSAVAELSRPTDLANAGSVEMDREKRSRKKGRIEVLEIYNRADKTVTTVAGRKVLLRGPRPWPFWHGQYPFVVFSTQPFPFSLQGSSVVDKLSHLQEAVWDVMNQRHDNLKFLNNAIAIVRADVDDPDLPYEPQAQWFLDDPTQVQMWSPPSTAAEISLPAEQLLTSAMQNLAGGHPFTTTSEASDSGADTATEAALVSNIAQGMERRAKTELYYSYQRIGQQRTELNQQFVRMPIYDTIIGKDQQPVEVQILPELLQGDFLFDISPMSESLMRSERRAEAQGVFQTFIQAAPVLTASGVAMNYKALAQDLLEAFDKDNTDRYFSSAPPPPPQAPPGQPQQQGAPGLQPQVGGTTAPQSIAANVSPSHNASLAPSQFQQRLGAQTGGVSNV
jgi:hypothetical protein